MTDHMTIIIKPNTVRLKYNYNNSTPVDQTDHTTNRWLMSAMWQLHVSQYDRRTDTRGDSICPSWFRFCHFSLASLTSQPFSSRGKIKILTESLRFIWPKERFWVGFFFFPPDLWTTGSIEMSSNGLVCSPLYPVYHGIDNGNLKLGYLPVAALTVHFPPAPGWRLAQGPRLGTVCHSLVSTTEFLAQCI